MIRDFIYKHKKKIVIGGVLVFLVILVVGVFGVVENNLNSVTVNITVSPLSAKIKIGDNEYNATDTIKIRPGTYTVEIYAEGFITKTGELVAVDGETVELSLYLDPTEENSDWYSENIWDGTARGDIISFNNLQDFYSLQKKYPILNYVPYFDYNYGISYKQNCESEATLICLLIKADFGYRDYAVKYLQLTDQELAPYLVKGDGYEMPFRRLELNVPSGLSYVDGQDLQIDIDESKAVELVVNNYINESLNTDDYNTNVLQVKKYSDSFYGVKVRVFKGGYMAFGDTYRMIIGKIDGELIVLTNLEILLSSYRNPLMPVNLLEAVNKL